MRLGLACLAALAAAVPYALAGEPSTTSSTTTTTASTTTSWPYTLPAIPTCEIEIKVSGNCDYPSCEYPSFILIATCVGILPPEVYAKFYIESDSNILHPLEKTCFEDHVTFKKVVDITVDPTQPVLQNKFYAAVTLKDVRLVHGHYKVWAEMSQSPDYMCDSYKAECGFDVSVLCLVCKPPVDLLPWGKWGLDDWGKKSIDHWEPCLECLKGHPYPSTTTTWGSTTTTTSSTWGDTTTSIGTNNGQKKRRMAF